MININPEGPRGEMDQGPTLKQEKELLITKYKVLKGKLEIRLSELENLDINDLMTSMEKKSLNKEIAKLTQSIAELEILE